MTALASSTAGKLLTATGTAPYFSWETSGGGSVSTLVADGSNEITVGSTTSALTVNIANAALSAAQTINIGSGSTGATSTSINIGGGTGANIINIATGATNAKTVNIGTGAGIVNLLTVGAASTTLSIAASTTFGGNVGLASLTNSLLQVNSSGIISVFASSTAGKVLTATSTAPYFSWESATGIPSGLVAFFNLSSCPSGWTEATAARGRYIVGLPSGGSLASTTGTALTDKENRAVGEHAHGITDPGHVHTHYPDGAGISNQTAVGGGGFSYYTNSGNTSSNTTGISITATGTTAGTNAPYIQYLACSKD